MAAPPPPPPPKPAFSLYGNLVDPNEPAPAAPTISSAPVRYNQDDAPTAKKPMDAALRFQPVRRPQVKQAKPKPMIPKTIPSVSASSSATAPTPGTAPAAAATSKLADWAPTEEDEWRYGTGEKHQRGGRKNKKKKLEQQDNQTNWDELYDPSRPTNVEEYLHSDEKIDEVREWKALLYRGRRKAATSDFSDSDDAEDYRPTRAFCCQGPAYAANADFMRVLDQFAPPPSYGAVAPPPAPSTDETGDDAFARRQALSSQQPPLPTESSSATISAAPVRYENVPPPPRSPSPPRVTSKTTFARRLMSKYGWKAGTGLGASSSGIVTPLHAQAEKRRKKADADGGGWAEPGGKGKILGGKGAKEEEGRFGAMSEVIVLRNMLDNISDLQAEISDGLGQEIGSECGEKVRGAMCETRMPLLTVI